MPNGQYDDTNRGVLFPNDKKTPGSKQPDYRGTLDVQGVAHNVSAWKKIVQKEGKNKGREFLTLQVELADQDQNDQSQQSYPRQTSSYQQPRHNQSEPVGAPQNRRNAPVREENPFNDDDGPPF